MFNSQQQQGTRIKNFHTLKTLILWAGWLGVIQSLTWIGLTITGILAYNCVISVAAKLSYGSLLRTIFLDIYFKGFTGCTPNVYQQYNYTMIQSVPTVLDPEQILIWDSVYLAVAVCWLVSSLMLLFFVRKDNVPLTLGIIHTWVFLVCAVSCMDVALGVIFGIDYGRFQNAAYNYNINSINAGVIDPNAAQLIAGEEAAIAMMFVSFKGFVFWLVNVGLMFALFVRGIIIARQNTDEGTLFRPRKDSDVLTTRPPILAYEEKQKAVFTNEAFVPDNRSMDTVELNEDALVRAAHLSRDVNLLERRFRNIDSYKQYTPAPIGTGSRDSFLSEQDTVIVTAALPAPDYSPQVSRIDQPQQQNGILRSKRF